MTSFEIGLQCGLSIQAAIVLWLMGNGSAWGPAIGLGGQVVWIYYVVLTKQYGLLPSVAVFTVVHARNYWKMHKSKQ